MPLMLDSNFDMCCLVYCMHAVLGWELLLQLRRPAQKFLGDDFPLLLLVAEHETSGRLHVKITLAAQTAAPAAASPEAERRWEVPDDLLPR